MIFDLVRRGYKQRRSTESPKVERYDNVLFRTDCFGNFLGTGQLFGMSLAIAKRQGIDVISLFMCNKSGHRGIKAS
jgi:hypothetical protein